MAIAARARIQGLDDRASWLNDAMTLVVIVVAKPTSAGMHTARMVLERTMSARLPSLMPFMRTAKAPPAMMKGASATAIARNAATAPRAAGTRAPAIAPATA